MNAPPIGNPPTFRPDVVDCPGCKGHGRIVEQDSAGFYTDGLCDECEGRMVVDASCAECQCITTISDDGLCEKCTDACTLPIAEYEIKYPLTGWAKAEAAALNRRAA